jgi:hypothetical protein
MVEDPLYTLYKYAMGQLMEKEAKTHKYFFTQEEFEKNRHDIFNITGAKRKIQQERKDVEKKENKG